MGAFTSRFVSVLLTALLIFVGTGDLFGLTTKATPAACPHHVSHDECMMAMCPMSHQEQGSDTTKYDSPVSVSCPTDDTSASLHSRVDGETVNPSSFFPAMFQAENSVYINVSLPEWENPPLEKPPNS